MTSIGRKGMFVLLALCLLSLEKPLENRRDKNLFMMERNRLAYLRSLTYFVLSQFPVIVHAIGQRYHSIDLRCCTMSQVNVTAICAAGAYLIHKEFDIRDATLSAINPHYLITANVSVAGLVFAGD